MSRKARGGKGGGPLRLVLTLAVVLAVGILVGSAVSQWGGEGGLPSVPGIAERVSERVRVEVLNGGGQAGAAREATDALREAGFDVVFFGNAGTFDRDSSVVLDRIGEVGRARSVADALGIRSVRSEPDSNLYLDVTVVLGKDWAPAPDPSDTVEAPGSPGRPWWDPRGWLGRRARPSIDAEAGAG